MGNLLDRLKNRYRLDVSRVVENYDKFLQHALITTTSFQGIINGKLNRTNRFLQLILFVYYFVYFFPKFLTLAYAYTRDAETRVYYQYLLADYSEEMGLLGRTINMGYLLFAIEIAFNFTLMIWFERKSSVEFLTDWLDRTPRMIQVEEEEGQERDLDNDVKQRLMSQLHFKTVFAKILGNTFAGVQVYEIFACLLFLYKRRPSFGSSCLALFNCSAVVLFFTRPGYHFPALYLSFIAVTDYFITRINQMTERVTKLQTTQLTNENLSEVLNDYDQLMTVFKKYDKVLKHLLRNLIHFYAFGLTALFLIFTLDTETQMLLLIAMPAATYSLIILATGVYISQLNGMVSGLYNELACIPARHCKNKRVSLKNIIRLRLVIKELGSLETDGQFVIGLRDGNGPAISRLEIFELTISTLSNTLMIIDMVKNN